MPVKDGDTSSGTGSPNESEEEKNIISKNASGIKSNYLKEHCQSSIRKASIIQD